MLVVFRRNCQRERTLVIQSTLPKKDTFGTGTKSGAPNDDFPLITLKTLFRLSGVLLDL